VPLLRRVTKSLARYGVRATLFKVYVLTADYWFDARYGTDTTRFINLKDLTVTSVNKGRGSAYQPSRVVPLRMLFERLEPMMPDDAVLLDLGCGKGRVLMVAAGFAFREARGVEFARELCDVARKNCDAYARASGTRTRLEVVEADVLDYAIRPDENVFFFFNPFDDVMMRRIVDNIAASVEAAPRKVLILYYNPRFESAVEQQERFSKLADLRFWGYHFAVYSNAEDGAAVRPS
jgi:hypothetical protein